MAQLALKYRERHGRFHQLGCKTVPKRVKPSILRGNTELLENGF
jgi:hypothetical protein